MASYPSSVVALSTKNDGDTVFSSHVDALQDEIIAVENGLLAGLAHSLLPDANGTRDLGSVAKAWANFYTTTLTVNGVSTLTGAVTVTAAATFSSADNSFKVGASTETHKGSGLINTDFTPASNTTTASANDTLFTYTLPANALNANGRVIRVTAYGTFGATGNTKTVRLWWNGTAGTNFVVHSSTSNGTKWVIIGHIMRTASNAQDLWGYLPMSGAAQDINAFYTTATVTDSNAINIVVTGSSAGAINDVNYKGSLIEFLN